MKKLPVPPLPHEFACGMGGTQCLLPSGCFRGIQCPLSRVYVEWYPISRGIPPSAVCVHEGKMPSAAGCLRLDLLAPLSVGQSGPFPPIPLSPNARGYRAAPIPLPCVTGSTQTPPFTYVRALWGQKGHLVNPVPLCGQCTPFWGGQRAEAALSPRFLRCGAEGHSSCSMWCLLGWQRVCGAPGEGSVAPQNTHGGEGATSPLRPPPPRGTRGVCVRGVPSVRTPGPCVRGHLGTPTGLCGGHTVTAPTKRPA